MANKYLDYAGLSYFANKIKALFVQKEDGKGLSTEDYTTAEKSKLTNLPADAERNIITGIQRNGLTVTPSNRIVNVEVPVKVSDLSNDSNFMSQAEVLNAISNAQHMTKEIVDVLPTTGEDFVMYLVPENGGTDNIYEEWLWINNAWEKIGDTATVVDLTPYLKKTDMVAITNVEIDNILATI